MLIDPDQQNTDVEITIALQKIQEAKETDKSGNEGMPDSHPLIENTDTAGDSEKEESDKEYENIQQALSQNLSDQMSVNDLIRDLASRLKERGKRNKNSFLLDEGVKFSGILQERNNNIRGLMDKIKSNIYNSKEWRMFIDSSQLNTNVFT